MIMKAQTTLIHEAEQLNIWMKLMRDRLTSVFHVGLGVAG